MIAINKIDLNDHWIDSEWNLFETTFTTVSKAQFSDDNVFVIKEEDVVIGLVELDFFVEEKVCHITEFEIKRNFRGRGYGFNAVNAILKELKECDCINKIELCPKNYNVGLFWKKCGFNYYAGSDDTMFIKNI